MLNLSNTTLLCVDCVNAERAVAVLEHCVALCRFGAVKFLTSLETDYPHEKIRPLCSLNDYSAFMMKESHRYVPTPFILTVQHDGWIVNADSWENAWFKYDYIGPLYLQEKAVNDESVGSGGFSFRSRAMMATVSEMLPPWDGCNSWSGCDGKNNWGHEDGVISKYLRPALCHRGFKFCPPMDAGRFAYGGNPNDDYYCPQPFGFHGFYAIDRLNGGRGDPISIRPSGEPF